MGYMNNGVYLSDISWWPSRMWNGMFYMTLLECEKLQFSRWSCVTLVSSTEWAECVVTAGFSIKIWSMSKGRNDMMGPPNLIKYLVSFWNNILCWRFVENVNWIICLDCTMEHVISLVSDKMIHWGLDNALFSIYCVWCLISALNIVI